jgi:hypothetical protein
MNRLNARRPILAAVLAALAALALPSVAAAKQGDRNNDRIPDRWEKRHHLSLKIDQAGRDQDRDQLRNRAEFLADDNPRDRDSDDDGVMDGEENAGTIESFDPASGRLVIALFNGGTVSGLVNDATRIKCEDEHPPATASSEGSGEPEPDDDRAGHREEPGEDHHGEGENEPEEEHNGGNSGLGSENSGPGSENSGPSGRDDDGSGANCTTADLIAGAVVEEAELELEHGVAAFEEVELAD